MFNTTNISKDVLHHLHILCQSEWAQSHLGYHHPSRIGGNPISKYVATATAHYS